MKVDSDCVFCDIIPEINDYFTKLRAWRSFELKLEIIQGYLIDHI